MSDTQAKVLPVEQVYGGQSTDKLIGPKASFSYGRAMEFRRVPSQLSVLPGPKKISGTTVTDLVENIVQVDDGTRYAFDKSGGFYKIATDNTVTKISAGTNGPTTGSDGLLYRSDCDAVYAATENDLRRYYPISGSPTWDQVYGASKSDDTNAYRTGGAQTYSVPTTLSEATADSCDFEPDIEPGYSVKVKIVTVGTGDLTLTLHDGLNDELASVTIAHADLVVGLNEFKFSEQIRLYVKPNARTYHYHLTSTVSGTTVQTGTASDLSTSDFEFWAYRFVETNSGFHPVAQFLQYTLIGNSNYLAVWEPLSPSDPPNNEFKRHRLTFPTGFEVIGIDKTDVYAVLALEKRSTDDSKDFQEGLIILWDGFSQTYNQIINVTGGAPEALFTYQNYPYFFVKGALSAWLGGTNTTTILPMPHTDMAYKSLTSPTRVYPNMMCVRDNLLHMGFPSTTDDTDIEYGVYTWGTLSKDFPASFGYGYVPSTMQENNTNTGNREIGCVRNFGDEMYIAWRDGTSYGIDVVDTTCDPASVFSFRTLGFNGGVTAKEKLALRFAIDCKAIPADVTITPVHQIDDATDITHDDMAEGDTRNVSSIDQGRFHRIVWGFDGTSTGTETPVFYDTSLMWDPLAGERTL